VVVMAAVFTHIHKYVYLSTTVMRWSRTVVVSMAVGHVDSSITVCICASCIFIFAYIHVHVYLYMTMMR